MNLFLLSLLLSVSSALSQNCSDENSSEIQNYIDNRCPRSWQYFDRLSGGWCMKVFMGNLNQPDAETGCNEHNATLSGMEDASEVTYIQFSGQVQMNAQSGSVWIGMKRTAQCANQTGRTVACSKTSSFEWTDGSTAGTDGFVWQTNQPDNMGGSSQCAILFVNKPSYVGSSSYWIGKLDDIPCTPKSYTLDGGRDIVGYVCGKKAKLG